MDEKEKAHTQQEHNALSHMTSDPSEWGTTKRESAQYNHMKKNFPLQHDRHAIASPLPTPVAKHTEQASRPRHFPAHATNNKTTHRNAMRLPWVACFAPMTAAVYQFEAWDHHGCNAYAGDVWCEAERRCMASYMPCSSQQKPETRSGQRKRPQKKAGYPRLVLSVK